MLYLDTVNIIIELVCVKLLVIFLSTHASLFSAAALHEDFPASNRHWPSCIPVSQGFVPLPVTSQAPEVLSLV